MSRGKDLIGVLRTVKNVGKKVAKAKKADVDHLVRGTTLKETVDSVAVTVTRIVKAVDEIQKAGGAKAAFRRDEDPFRAKRGSSTTSGTTSRPQRPSSTNIDNNNDDRTKSGTTRFSSLIPSLTDTSADVLPPQKRSFFGNRIWNDLFFPGSSRSWLRYPPSGFAFPRFAFETTSPLRGIHLLTAPYAALTQFVATRGLSSTAPIAKDDSEEIGDERKPTTTPKARATKAPPTAADIKKRLKAKPKLPSSAKENRVPTVRQV